MSYRNHTKINISAESQYKVRVQIKELPCTMYDNYTERWFSNEHEVGSIVAVPVISGTAPR